MERIFQGSARVPRVGERVLAVANFSEDCFGKGAETNTRGRVCSPGEACAVSDLRFVLRQSR